MSRLSLAAPPTGGGGSGNLDFLPDWAIILLFGVMASAATVASYRKWKAGKGLVHLYSMWIPAAVFVAVVVVLVVN